MKEIETLEGLVNNQLSKIIGHPWEMEKSMQLHAENLREAKNWLKKQKEKEQSK
jgi:hypothetical protein